MKTEIKLSQIKIIDEEAAGAINSLLYHTSDFFSTPMVENLPAEYSRSANPFRENIVSLISDIENLMGASAFGSVQLEKNSEI